VLATDDTHNLWVFFGTGRYYSNQDKTTQDIQHFFGVKDCTITDGCSQASERNNLYNASFVTVCVGCAPDKNVSVDGGGTYTKGFDAGTDALVNNLQGLDGWFTTLPTTRERTLSRATLIGGTLFFTTFTPASDMCAGSGEGRLYALYYLTGTSYKESSIGTSLESGQTVVNRSVSLGAGMPSEVTVQIGRQGTGGGGVSSNSGCVGRITSFIQTSTSALSQVCSQPPLGESGLAPWSRMVAWRDL
jgi:type IV pilus assembly protein PilY1